MTIRVLAAGGLAEMGGWDAFARVLGAELAKASVGVSLPWTTPFGRSLVEGYAKAAPAAAPTLVRVHAEDGSAPPASLAPFAAPPLPGDLAREGASLAEADVVILAGNGRGLHDLARLAQRRNVPIVPLPIEGTTSEEIWEETLRRPHRFPDDATRAAYLALRRPDARSAKLAASLAALLAGLAKRADTPARPHTLLVLRSEAAAGEDDAVTVVRRALRERAPAATIEVATEGWLRSPGRAFAEMATAADLVVADLAVGPAAVYAIGLARGAGRAAVAIARRGAETGVDARAMDAVLFETDRELGVRLARKLPAALSATSARAETVDAASAIAAGKAALAAREREKREAANARRREREAANAAKPAEAPKRKRKRGRRGGKRAEGATPNESAPAAPQAPEGAPEPPKE